MIMRAVRNHNPGNLDAGDHWQGLLPRSRMTPEQAAETRFAVFASPKWGFRALAVILLNYEWLHALDTVQKIISRWAPRGENNTGAYVRAVCDGIGKEPDAVIDVHDPAILTGLCKAIAIHESGGWFFSPSDLAAGVALAEAAP